MRRFSMMMLSVGAALLAACGGTSLTGSSSSSSSSGGTGPTVTGISVVTSLPQISSGSNTGVTITASTFNASNNTVPGATVTFTATSGLLAVGSSVTDANGAATATLTAGADPANRTITVTATSGTASATVLVAVTGTTLSISGPQQLVEPDSATYTVTLTNGANQAVVGQAVALTSANGNTLSAPSVTTDANGVATFTVTAAAGGTDTLTATALGLSAAESVSVSAQSFVITAPANATDINLGVSTPVTVTWTNNGAAVTGQTVQFAATRGTLSAASAVTNGSGVATVMISSTTSGQAVISASGTGVSTSTNVDFIATNATAIATQASPSTINVGAQSTITAVVRDPDNNLVEGKLVSFELQDVTGGSLSVASSLTNDQGVAQTIYSASSSTSATNGVVVTATVQGTSVSDSASLTVAGQTTFLSLGTGALITPLNSVQYQLPYSVTAVDEAGNAVIGATVDLKVTSVAYRKGSLVLTVPPTTAAPTGTGPWIYGAVTTCASEDLNNNGILDPGEDFNGNGRLDPGSVADASPGTVVTDTAAQAATDGTAAGSSLFNIIYPKDHALWVEITLTATATVSGTESSTSATFWLPGLAADYASASTAPPGQNSPYGVAQSCADPN